MRKQNDSFYNIWPVYTDLLLGFLIVIILIFSLLLVKINLEIINKDEEIKQLKAEIEKLKGNRDYIQEILKNQENLVKSIAIIYKNKEIEKYNNKYRIKTFYKGDDIIIEHYDTLQRIIFSGNILFDTGDYKLNNKGKDTLKKVGNEIKKKLSLIREIQIQGHADNQKNIEEFSNLGLAGKRAFEVFKFFQDNVNIDPTRHLMSATSFGEYKPINRKDEDYSYNKNKLEQDNRNEEIKKLNRRIELLLFYRTDIR